MHVMEESCVSSKSELKMLEDGVSPEIEPLENFLLYGTSIP